jgi:hypothetical protein
MKMLSEPLRVAKTIHRLSIPFLHVALQDVGYQI